MCDSLRGSANFGRVGGLPTFFFSFASDCNSVAVTQLVLNNHVGRYFELKDELASSDVLVELRLEMIENGEPKPRVLLLQNLDDCTYFLLGPRVRHLQAKDSGDSFLFRPPFSLVCEHQLRKRMAHLMIDGMSLKDVLKMAMRRGSTLPDSLVVSLNPRKLG